MNAMVLTMIFLLRQVAAQPRLALGGGRRFVLGGDIAGVAGRRDHRQVAIKIEFAAAWLAAAGVVGDLHVGDPDAYRSSAASMSSPLLARWNRSQRKPTLSARRPGRATAITSSAVRSG